MKNRGSTLKYSEGTKWGERKRRKRERERERERERKKNKTKTPRAISVQLSYIGQTEKREGEKKRIEKGSNESNQLQ